jgi:hypothetical protein
MLAVGHEDAHVISNGIGVALANLHSGVTRTHLIHHPEHAFTGNLAFDAIVHEERSATGMADLSFRRAMESLGYSKDQVKDYMSHVAVTHPPEGRKGDNQLDHLSSASAQAGPHELVSDSASTRDKNAGSLGYTKPFSPEEIIEAFIEAPVRLDTIEKRTLAANITPQQWLDTVRSTRKDPSVQAHLTQLAQERAQAISEQKRAGRRKQLLGALMVVATVAAGGTGAALGMHKHPEISTETRYVPTDSDKRVTNGGSMLQIK